ncbi:MAG: glycosyltransferase family 2 protein [Porticoccaceae bacterium]|nr:glycosyltransferase family 2 protein [Porticoccaceae bacterium]
MEDIKKSCKETSGSEYLTTVGKGRVSNNLQASKRSSQSSSEPSVAVLLCTKDGDRFLDEQIKSIRTQDHQNIRLFASDDGSTDNTRNILNTHRSSWSEGSFAIKPGPQEGYAANFLSLVCCHEIEADYYAFADQDDIWEADKLSRAISKLEASPPNTPTLYCSRRKLIEENGVDIGQTPLFRRPPSFENSLVQSLSGGNTMVFNRAACDILRKAGQQHIASHDWWAYSLITGAGGVVIYDPHSSTRYRQHEDNILGASPGWRASWLRIRLMLEGRFKNWNAINTSALQQVRELLTPENKVTLDKYMDARSRWLLPRILGVWRSGVYRQTVVGNLGLLAATLLNKI